MASLFGDILMYSVFYSYGLISGITILIKILYLWLTLPSGTLFKIKKRPTPPECLNNPELGEHKYIQLNNVKLHYVEKGDPTKPLMIMLHGFPEFWYSWRHQIKQFSKDFWIIAPDLRGYGDSEKPAGRKYYQIKYLVEDVKNLINALGREKATIVAHDWGGIIAWFFVMIYSQMVDSYVIMNAPHPIIFRKFISTSFTQLRMSWYFFFFQIPYLPELFIQLRDLRFLNVIFYTKKKVSPYNEEDKEAYRFTFAKPGNNLFLLFI